LLPKLTRALTLALPFGCILDGLLTDTDTGTSPARGVRYIKMRAHKMAACEKPQPNIRIYESLTADW